MKDMRLCRCIGSSPPWSCSVVEVSFSPQRARSSQKAHLAALFDTTTRAPFEQQLRRHKAPSRILVFLFLQFVEQGRPHASPHLAQLFEPRQQLLRHDTSSIPHPAHLKPQLTGKPTRSFTGPCPSSWMITR